jgi:hypothetical protein
MTGLFHELCSCKLLCPCWLGPEIEPDQGWCGGAVIFDIQQGESDRVDLSGCKAAFVADWPGNFWAGNGTAQVFIDEAATADQRRELEGILTGKKGGPMEEIGSAVVTRWLPTQFAPIGIEWGEETTATIGDIGVVKSRQLKDGAGRTTTVQGAAAMAAFQLESMVVAHSDGSRWANPGMHQWEGSSGTKSTLNWSG